ncbi:GGDEF domain-containing protein [Methyloversatilis sp.]|uniref:GGDEF domain-containing protein n=1 Tax=Methyloversatilis sp. TaxID=2569862 RepID=UPI003F71B94E
MNPLDPQNPATPQRRAADPQPASAAPSLLLIDDDPGSVQVLSRMLAGLGHLRFALSGADALALARASAPDVVLVDAEMPVMNGFEFCARLKTEPGLAEVPVIFVTSHSDVETEVAGFAAGAADFIRKPPVAEVVQARVGMQLRLKALGDKLRRNALTDGLTGVANRRRFDEDIQAKCERARRTGEPLSLLIVDVDHFKRYNDRYGHVAGDACLRQVAAALQSVTRRPADGLARYGGEEFALLLPQTEIDGALALAQRAVDAVAALHIEHAGSPLGRVVTVSVGAAAARRTADGAHTQMAADALVDAADRALYAAKYAGRGRCCALGQATHPALSPAAANTAAALQRR